MEEFDKFFTILIEKCAEYIWQHNQYIKQLKWIRNFYFYNSSIIIYLTGFILLLFNSITSNMKIILGLSNLFVGFLFTVYHLKNYDRIYERHLFSRYRLKFLYNDLFPYLNMESYGEMQLDFLLLKHNQFKNIIVQSPHIPNHIRNKFIKKFKHLIDYNPHLQTRLILDMDPKEYRQTFHNLMHLTKCFHIWKNQMKNSKLYRQRIILASNLGPFYKKNSFLYDPRPFINHRQILEFQNIKLGQNNLEIEIK